MNRFAYATPRSLPEAAELVKGGGKYALPVLKAGGMDLVDHLKEGLLEPDLVVNIKRLRDTGAGPGPISAAAAGGLRIEATATLAQIAASEAVLSAAPVVAQAAGSAASPQVRNVGTAAGNLLQRPRCWYYRHEQFDCLKKGGPVCYAVAGENKFHAIFGDGPCHIVHPSNLAPALSVCDAVVHVIGGGRASLPIAALFHPPSSDVRTEHTLKPGEVITHLTLASARASGFYAVKEKQSFDWPLVTACVALDLDGAKIKSARVCAGAVAPVPWPLPEVGAALAGVSLDDDAALRAACAKAAAGATPMTDNAYKARLLPVAVRRAVLIAAGRLTGAEVPA